MTGNGSRSKEGFDSLRAELSLMFPEEGAELASLAQLAAQLSEALVVLDVPAAFSEKLRGSLVAAAAEREAKPDRRRLPAPRTVGLAATASAVSVAVGVAAYWALSRTRTAHG